MFSIVLNNANAAPDAAADDESLIDALREYFERESLPINIAYATSFDRLSTLVSALPDVIAVFTNFAPDSTFGDSLPARTPISGIPGGYTVPADGYGKAKSALAAFCARNPTPAVIVVTGAPRATLPDAEILRCSTTARITIRRKRDLFLDPAGYFSAYATLIAGETTRRIRALSANAKPSPSMGHVRQLMRERLDALCVCVMCHRTAVAMLFCGLARAALGELSGAFRFRSVGTLSDAHDAITREPVEVIVALDEGEYWSSMLNDLESGVGPFGVFWVNMGGADSVITEPRIRQYTDQGLHWILDVQGDDDGVSTAKIGDTGAILRLLDAIAEEAIRARGAKVAGPLLHTLFVDCAHFLQDGEWSSVHKALRCLTTFHYDFVETVRSSRRATKYFVPVSSTLQFQQVAAKCAVLADLSVFTYLYPGSDFNLTQGTEMMFMPLWYLERATLGTLMETSFLSAIQALEPLVRSGRLAFYPSPNLVFADDDSAPELSVKMQGLLRDLSAAGRSDMPIAAFNQRANAYFSADALGAQHVVIKEEPVIGKLGQALAEIELPYVEGASAADLSSILAEHEESLAAFRGRVAYAVEDLMASGDEPFRSQIRRQLTREISDGVRELNERLDGIKRSKALQMSRSVVLTTTVTLCAIGLADVPAITGQLVGGAGLGPLLFQYLDYLQMRRAVQKSPYYFFWKLSQAAK